MSFFCAVGAEKRGYIGVGRHKSAVADDFRNERDVRVEWCAPHGSTSTSLVSIVYRESVCYNTQMMCENDN